MDISTLGWLYLGLVIGFLLGAFVSGLLGSSKMGDLEADNAHLKFVREALKEEIFRLSKNYKPRKPQPRLRRNLHKKNKKNK